MTELHFANAVCAAYNGNRAPVTVDLVDVQPHAVRTTVRELQPGMTVWDIWGNDYTLDRVTHFRHGARIYRSDGEVEWFDYRTWDDSAEQTFTVRLP